MSRRHRYGYPSTHVLHGHRRRRPDHGGCPSPAHGPAAVEPADESPGRGTGRAAPAAGTAQRDFDPMPAKSSTAGPAKSSLSPTRRAGKSPTSRTACAAPCPSGPCPRRAASSSGRRSANSTTVIGASALKSMTATPSASWTCWAKVSSKSASSARPSSRTPSTAPCCLKNRWSWPMPIPWPTPARAKLP